MLRYLNFFFLNLNTLTFNTTLIIYKNISFCVIISFSRYSRQNRKVGFTLPNLRVRTLTVDTKGKGGECNNYEKKKKIVWSTSVLKQNLSYYSNILTYICKYFDDPHCRTVIFLYGLYLKRKGIRGNLRLEYDYY